MRDCPTCGQPIPEGSFCVRCGAPQDQTLEHSRQRSQFAAAPGERRYAPWLTSTLFPQLPRHSDRHFRIVLVTCAVAVILLGALRLFGVALIVAALLMPLLTILYIYDVDVYDDEPARGFALTVLWGAVTGAVTGAIAKAITSSGTSLIDRSSSSHVLVGGIVIPLLGVILMLAGPLLLLRVRKYDNALDGASFGSACAATFAAAEAVVVGVGVLSGGLRPIGATAPWIERLLAIAVATPVLAMSTIGVAGAAIWLRYRAPSQDRSALGPLGEPIVAVLAAAALIVLGAVTETFMPAGAWLVTLVVLDVIGLLLLRQALHVGLLEESLEHEIGEPIKCVNCGQMTPVHTFCVSCGVALRALPKGEHRAGARRRLTIAGVALLSITGIGFAVAAVAAPAPRQTQCQQGTVCGAPPIGAQALFAFPGYTVWRSSDLHYSLRYPNSIWSVGNQNADDVVLDADNGDGAIIVRGARASQANPAAMIRAQVSSVQSQLLGVARDTHPSDQLLGTNVGLVPGPGVIYGGTIASPQGPQQPVVVAILAASTGGVTIGVMTVAPANNPGAAQQIFALADDIIDSVEFTS